MILQSYSLAYIQRKLIWKDTCISMFIAVLFTIAKTWKQPKCSLTGKWVKMWCIYTCIYIYIVENYSSRKKEWSNAICSNKMDLEIIILSNPKISIIWLSLIYGIFTKKIQMSRPRDIEHKLLVTKGEAGGLIRRMGLTYTHYYI